MLRNTGGADAVPWDGRSLLDNIVADRQQRPIALGREDWLVVAGTTAARLQRSMPSLLRRDHACADRGWRQRPHTA